MSEADDYEKKGKSLWGLLQTLDELDQEEELKEDETARVLGDIKEKVDSYKYVADRYSAEISRVDSIIKGFQAKKKALKNGLDRFKAHAAKVMESNGMDEIQGNLYKARLQSSVRIVPLIEPRLTPATSLYIRTKNEWDKTKIKEDYESKPELKEYARLEINQSVRFS